MNEKLLLRPEEAFEAIQVRTAKGWRMIANGELPSIKIGGLRRVPVEALQRWVQDKMAEFGLGGEAK